MPSQLEVVRAYVEGRKFRTLKAEKDFNFQRLEPYIVPSQKRRQANSTANGTMVHVLDVVVSFCAGSSCSVLLPIAT